MNNSDSAPPRAEPVDPSDIQANKETNEHPDEEKSDHKPRDSKGWDGKLRVDKKVLVDGKDQDADDGDDFGDDFDEFAEGGEGDEDFGDFDEANDEPQPSHPPLSQLPTTPDVLKGLVSRISCPNLALDPQFISVVDPTALVNYSLIRLCPATPRPPRADILPYSGMSSTSAVEVR